MPASELPELDRRQLLREIELQALRDSQSDWFGVAPADVPPGPVHREVDRWAEQRLARIDAARADAEAAARARIREADATEAATDERRARADDEAAAAGRRQAGIEAVLRGEKPGDDGGGWADSDRMGENRRRRKAVDLLIYGAAAVAEVGLNYLAFRLMGTTPVETALLAAAVVLVTVLLPKQLGAMVTTARRTGRWRGWPLVSLLAGTQLWVAAVVFVAVIRTAYLLLPQQVGATIGRPALLAVAGVGPLVLTLGWTAVALAVGLAVLLRSAHRHNPYASAWHRAVGEAQRLAVVRSERRAAAERAAERAARERDALREAGTRFVPLSDECRALAAELKDRYVHTLGRRRASVEQLGLPRPTRPALGSPEDGTAA
jgi:hypothetical protein